MCGRSLERNFFALTLKVSEVVGPYGCIDVPVMDVSTVYGYIYYAYYVTKRDEYSHVPAGIG